LSGKDIFLLATDEKRKAQGTWLRAQGKRLKQKDKGAGLKSKLF